MVTITRDGKKLAATDLADLRPESGSLLWVDLDSLAPDDVAKLARGFNVHPLAVEDILNRNQRPKLDEYASNVFAVVFAASGDSAAAGAALVELHIVLGENYVITIAASRVAAIETLHETVARRPEMAQGAADRLFARIADAVVDSILPLLDQVDAGIEGLEAEILDKPLPTTVQELFRLRRDLGNLRRVLGPQRDLFQSLTTPRTQFVGDEAQLYLRDVYDHTVRIAEELDTFRDTVTGALDVYLSSVSNRLGAETKRLTVVATIFLPLTFLTGFFGMNFGALVSAISSPLAFLLGIITMAISTVVVLVGVGASRFRPHRPHVTRPPLLTLPKRRMHRHAEDPER